MERLMSKKFWMTVAALITLAVAKKYDEAFALVLGYLGVQGAIDAKSV